MLPLGCEGTASQQMKRMEMMPCTGPSLRDRDKGSDVDSTDSILDPVPGLSSYHSRGETLNSVPLFPYLFLFCLRQFCIAQASPGWPYCTAENELAGWQQMTLNSHPLASTRNAKNAGVQHLAQLFPYL